MSQQPGSSNRGDTGDRVPVMQEMFDNIWLIFLMSGVIVLVSYIIWGLVEMLSVPTLP